MKAKNKIRIMIRRIVRLAIIAIFSAGIIHNVLAGWKRIGLSGIEISAITDGVDKLNGSQAIILIGTRDSGIYSISGFGDTIRRYPRYTNASDKPAGRIRALFATTDGIMSFAGTDSGLYGESLIFSSLPAWKKIQSMPSEPVMGIACNDSTYCVATVNELYRAKSPFGAWAPCSVSKWLPSPARPLNFTSLVSWGYASFTAGSSASAGPNSFGGVIAGGNNALRWENRTCVYGTCVDSNVYSLTIGDMGKLYAGTSRGIFWALEFDTGTWYQMAPQLAAPPVRHIYVTNDSVTHDREIYASTDSGVYVLSPQIHSNQWTLSLKLKTYGVASPMPKYSNAVYAATADGVWKYEPTTATHIGISDKLLFLRKRATGIYSIDGKKLSSNAHIQHMNGVLIALTKNGICKKLIVSTEPKTRSLF